MPRSYRVLLVEQGAKPRPIERLAAHVIVREVVESGVRVWRVTKNKTRKRLSIR